MLKWILELDQSFLLWLNGLHFPALDPWMFWISEGSTWYPLYLGLIIYLITRQKKKIWITVLAIVLLILLSDGITSHFMKPFFQRLRPSHEPSIQSQLHIIHQYRGGLYGFASSHAANSFALAFFLIWNFFSQRSFLILLLFWASLVSYSRIYLGVHYPLDILFGALVGIFSAGIASKFYKNLQVYFYPD